MEGLAATPGPEDPSTLTPVLTPSPEPLADSPAASPQPEPASVSATVQAQPPVSPVRALPPPPPRAGLGLLLLVVALALVTGIALGGSLSRFGLWPVSAGDSSQFSRAAAAVMPAVVSVRVDSPAALATRGFFGLPPEVLGGAATRPHIEHSRGSGMVVDSRGYILTNAHVVKGSERIQVAFAGSDRTYLAQVVGLDGETDLALIKIDVGHPLPTVRFGDSDRLRVGDWVLAVGNPFALDFSVTAGIVSARQRDMGGDKQFEHFIQTDAAINPGNSGGPLLNAQGEVVGVSTAIYTDNDSYQGVGFALPSSLVLPIYRQLLTRGSVVRGSIGISFEPNLSAAVRSVYHLQQGVPVTAVAAHGPAAKAGLLAGDVITSVNGSPVSGGDALVAAVVDVPVGRTVRVGYVRNGASHTLEVEVADRARLYGDTNAADAPVPAPHPSPGLGLTVSPGLAIEQVAVDSFADRIGLEKDDVIVEVNHHTVTAAADLERLLGTFKAGDDVAFVIRRPNSDGTSSRWLLGGTVNP